MTMVVDASVAVKWLIEEEGTDAALQLFATEALAAPELWLSECANALWKAVGRGDFSADAAQRLLGRLTNARVTLSSLAPDIDAALAFANRLKHPVYDCVYLALATRLGCQVVTADRRFFAVVGSDPNLAPHIRLLGA